MTRPQVIATLLLLSLSCAAVRAETITVATYNVEHFQDHFRAHELGKKLGRKIDDPVLKELLDSERRKNDEDNWEVAQTITDDRFSPDVLVIQEGPTQENLEYFNKRWLRGAYETAVVFPSNTDRDQHLGLLLKPGFKLVERKDQYHLEKDTVAKPRTDRLFARGPAFALVQAPSGYRFWVGVTHQKSKASYLSDAEVEKLREANPGLSKAQLDKLIKEGKAQRAVEDSAWRNREAKRTHAIMKELAAAGPDDVILLGDMNDEVGADEAEQAAGGDAMAELVGPPEAGFVLVTKALAEKGENSFNGYWRPDFRSFIDHVVTTPAMRDQVQEVAVFRGNLARAASDHFPVYVKIRSDPAAGPATRPN